MEQLTQNLKDGKMEFLEVPFPVVSKGQVLVRNHFSLISAGTEGKTVTDARLGYIGKAKSRKEELNKVIQVAKKQGVIKTYQMVMNKLSSPSPLGYSCSGEVISVANDVNDFKVGDLVACGGNSANHSEVVSVPSNLCVKVPREVPLEEAAFTTVASIAMQGLRQAELTLGENCVVIGLGLVGQLTVQLLKASGVKVIGIDIDLRQVEKAKELGCELSLLRTDEQIKEKILISTNGFGADAIIITAGTNSDDPINFSGEIARQKAKVIIVGAVPTGFKRKNYFKKELDLRMSCSYGPGRYDNSFEEKGLDYPIGYVRWTEKRNMEAFVELLATKRVDLSKLISHRFKFDQAKKAYDLIVNKEERFSGILLSYDLSKTLKREVILSNKTFIGNGIIGLIGAGSFAQNFLLPNLNGQVSFKTIITTKPHNAIHVSKKYGFKNTMGNADVVFSDNEIDTVFIATRHDSHAQYVLKGLNSNKNIFVEKPLCLYEEELEEIAIAERNSKGSVMIGFNRRFSPHIIELKKRFKDIPLAINYRINAGILPIDHWVHDPQIGGGRILGEACHFIDLCAFITGSEISSVSAQTLEDSRSLNDTAVINISMKNGSIATISYFSNGNSELDKERIEIFGGGSIAIIDDFKTMKIIGSTTSVFKLQKQDKGHSLELKHYANEIKNNKEILIPFHETYNSMKATFLTLRSIRNNGETQFM